MEKNKIIGSMLIIAFVILLGSIFLPLKIKKDELVEQSRRQREAIGKLREENRILSEENRLLKESPEYIEEVARKEMGLIKRGEIIYRRSSEKEVE